MTQLDETFVRADNSKVTVHIELEGGNCLVEVHLYSSNGVCYSNKTYQSDHIPIDTILDYVKNTFLN